MFVKLAYNGKFNKSSFIMLSFIKESPEGGSPLRTGVTLGSVSESQAGLPWDALKKASLQTLVLRAEFMNACKIWCFMYKACLGSSEVLSNNLDVF